MVVSSSAGSTILGTSERRGCSSGRQAGVSLPNDGLRVPFPTVGYDVLGRRLVVGEFERKWVPYPWLTGRPSSREDAWRSPRPIAGDKRGVEGSPTSDISSASLSMALVSGTFEANWDTIA